MKGVIFVSHFHDFPGKKKKMPVQWKTALTSPMSFFRSGKDLAQALCFLFATQVCCTGICMWQNL